MTQIVASLHLGIALLALWVLLFVCVREYRVDALRQRLFAIRDELFDYAAEGNIDFDNNAYAFSRELLNGMIRFAHRISFSRLVLTEIMEHVAPMPASVAAPLRLFNREMNRLPEHQHAKLCDIHQRMMQVVVRHLITGSPILMFFFIVHRLAAFIHTAAKHAQPHPFDVHLRGMEQLKLQALEAQQLELQAA
jgi:hypothetical protein